MNVPLTGLSAIWGQGLAYLGAAASLVPGTGPHAHRGSVHVYRMQTGLSCGHRVHSWATDLPFAQRGPDGRVTAEAHQGHSFPR